MEVKTSPNNYGWISIHCPLCHYTTRESQKDDKLRWLKQHILRMAKTEAFEIYCDPTLPLKEIPHLEYSKKHTFNKKLIVTETRNFDDDLSLKK